MEQILLSEIVKSPCWVLNPAQPMLIPTIIFRSMRLLYFFKFLLFRLPPLGLLTPCQGRESQNIVQSQSLAQQTLGQTLSVQTLSVCAIFVPKAETLRTNIGTNTEHLNAQCLCHILISGQNKHLDKHQVALRHQRLCSYLLDKNFQHKHRLGLIHYYHHATHIYLPLDCHQLAVHTCKLLSYP